MSDAFTPNRRRPSAVRRLTRMDPSSEAAPRRRALPTACAARKTQAAADPTLRPAKVARAKKLLQDSAYPPPTVLRAVARRLARKLP